MNAAAAVKALAMVVAAVDDGGVGDCCYRSTYSCQTLLCPCDAAETWNACSSQLPRPYLSSSCVWSSCAWWLTSGAMRSSRWLLLLSLARR
jgi:hypothetical protein